MNKLIESGIEL